MYDIANETPFSKNIVRQILSCTCKCYIGCNYFCNPAKLNITNVASLPSLQTYVAITRNLQNNVPTRFTAT